MKRFSILSALFVAAIAITGCRLEEPEFITTDKGPSQTVTLPSMALMGSQMDFSVALNDEIALSTLKIKVLFDETVVADTTIRTKTNGTYEGHLMIPFLKDIPDGTATVKVTSQNIQFGLTDETYDLPVRRPAFEYLTLTDESGNSYKMEPKGDNLYEVSGSFPGEVNGKITTAPFDAQGRTLTFGYGSTGIELNGASPIPYSNGVAGDYTISFNTLTFEGSPFVVLTINDTKCVMADKENYYAVLNLTQGGTLTFDGYAPGYDDFIIDPDFFEKQADGSLKFLATDGLYKVNIGLTEKFFRVQRMASASDYATLSNGGAVWIIGEKGHYGKPTPVTAGWNTETGPLCMAEVSPKVHQATFEAGTQMVLTGLNIKFFHQHGWGGEFGGGSITTDSPLLSVGESDGNVHFAEGVKLDMGGIYRFTLDLNGYDGTTGAIVHFAKVGQNEVEADKITFGGVELAQTSGTTYQGNVSLKQGQSVKAEGIADIADWTIDPDFFETEGAGSYKLIPVDGYYLITADTDKKYLKVERATEAGATATLADDGTGAVWMIGGSCFGKPEIFSSSWSTDDGLCLAEVEKGKFVITLKAGYQLSTTNVDVKFFHQKGWGGEFGGGTITTSSDLVKITDSGNVNLASGVTLDLGADYRFTLNTNGAKNNATLTVEKVGEGGGSGAAIKVNGTELKQTAATVYAGAVDFTKGAAISVSGVDDILSYYIDPDYVDAKYQFASSTGKYQVIVDTEKKFATFKRLKDDGTEATLAEGALWLMAWGVAHPVMTSQLAWNPGSAYCMAEVEPKVFQMTGVAVEETDGTTVGGRFRYDYISMKYFHQDGWGGEMGTVTFSEEAAKLLKQDGNISLADGVKLTKGATYRLTIDLNDGEKVDFREIK